MQDRGLRLDEMAKVELESRESGRRVLDKVPSGVAEVPAERARLGCVDHEMLKVLPHSGPRWKGSARRNISPPTIWSLSRAGKRGMATFALLLLKWPSLRVRMREASRRKRAAMYSDSCARTSSCPSRGRGGMTIASMMGDVRSRVERRGDVKGDIRESRERMDGGEVLCPITILRKCWE